MHKRLLCFNLVTSASLALLVVLCIVRVASEKQRLGVSRSSGQGDAAICWGLEIQSGEIDLLRYRIDRVYAATGVTKQIYGDSAGGLLFVQGDSRLIDRLSIGMKLPDLTQHGFHSIHATTRIAFPDPQDDIYTGWTWHGNWGWLAIPLLVLPSTRILFSLRYRQRLATVRSQVFDFLLLMSVTLLVGIFAVECRGLYVVDTWGISTSRNSRGPVPNWRVGQLHVYRLTTSPGYITFYFLNNLHGDNSETLPLSGDFGGSSGDHNFDLDTLKQGSPHHHGLGILSRYSGGWSDGAVFDGEGKKLGTIHRFDEEFILAVPMWMVVLTALILPYRRMVPVFLKRRAARWIAQGKCGQCGYDLRATPNHCPECGEAVVRPAVSVSE